ncbi:MAG: sialate O-acetylesterase, partial [Planctomycetota bacterium]
MQRILTLLALLLFPSVALAEIQFSPVFGDSMVVQRDEPIHVWGWSEAGDEVTVLLAGHEASTKADENGRFDVQLGALPAGGPHELVVKGATTTTFKDVLVGEVWVCSGQSNMAWPVAAANDADLESLTANFPNIRLISVPNRAAQTPQNSFGGKWQACTPSTVKDFSAVGYFFGRQLHQTLGVPVGLIDNAWGGSAAEAWVPTNVLAQDAKYDQLMQRWETTIQTYDHDKAVANWKQRVAKWEAGGKKGNRPRSPRNALQGNQRPGNLYNGCLHPIIGFSIKGSIWYQGESNASRAYQYRDLFPLM